MVFFKMTLDIEKIKHLALDGDLYAVQELINRLEAAEKDAAIYRDLILLGEYKSDDLGVVWFDRNPHAFTVGTKFYAAMKESA